MTAVTTSGENWRHRGTFGQEYSVVWAGVDCDEVYPGIVLGNGATVKKKDYLRKIGWSPGAGTLTPTSPGMTHVLNAAEFRGVNVGEDFFAGTGIAYMGLRIEDTPQTQICRWSPGSRSYPRPRSFMQVADFIDSALSENGKVFVNCVFGRSRWRYCVVL